VSKEVVVHLTKTATASDMYQTNVGGKLKPPFDPVRRMRMNTLLMIVFAGTTGNTSVGCE